MANQTQQLKRLLEKDGVDTLFIPVNLPYQPRLIARWRGIRAIFRLFQYIHLLWRSAADVDIAHIMANSGWSWHLFATPAIVITRLRGVPVIVNYRGGGAEKFLKRSYRWVKPVLELSSAVVVPSTYLKGVFEKYGIDTIIIPNIIDTDLFFPSKTRVQQEEIKEPHIIVCRNLEKIYGIDIAIRAFSLVKKEYPGARMTVAGEGSELDYLRNLCKKKLLTDSVTFAGRLKPPEMADLYATADIFLNTSTVDNMPNSILEAMACKVPIVTSPAGGIPHIVEDRRHAIFIDLDDPPSIASKISELCQNKNLREEITKNAYEKIQSYTWNHISGLLYEVYEKAWSNVRCKG